LTIPTLESIYELRRSFGDYTSYPNLATHTWPLLHICTYAYSPSVILLHWLRWASIHTHISPYLILPISLLYKYCSIYYQLFCYINWAHCIGPKRALRSRDTGWRGMMRHEGVRSHPGSYMWHWKIITVIPYNSATGCKLNYKLDNIFNMSRNCR
jgi:hypothetical protein